LASIEQDGYNNLDAAEAAYHNAVACNPMQPSVWTAYARFAETTKRLDAFKTFLMDTNSRVLSSGKPPLPHVAALAKVWKQGPGTLVEATASLVGVVQGKTGVPGLRPMDLDMKWAIVRLAEEARSPDLSQEDAARSLMELGVVCSGVNELELANQLFPAAMGHVSPELQVVCAQYWADTMLRLKRSTEAENLLYDMVRRMPDSADLRTSLARCLSKNGKKPEAEAEYRKLLELPGLKPEERAKIQAEFDGFLRK
jgi:tetratricopeptide (TPR) repeat protein